jgi:hypothetical protein
MTNTPLEDRDHDSLHRRVDPMQHSPFTVTDVRRRARRIQRRRTVAASAAVAAALAVAVPVGLAMNGPAQRTDMPPATRTPQITGPVLVDPRSADVGDAPAVPLVDATGPRLVAGDQTFDLPVGYDQITPYQDGWIAMHNVDGARTITVLDDTFGVVEQTEDNSALTVSPDGTRVTFAFYDGRRWSILNNAVAGGELERPWTTLPDGPYASEVFTIGFVSDTEVLAGQLDQGDGTITTFVADGDDREDLPGLDQARSASPVTGMVAGRTTLEDGRSCGAVVDGRARSGASVWTSCDHELGAFSPDGRHLVGFAVVPDGPSPTLSILDATSGEPVIDFEVAGARNRVVGLAPEVAWEDDETLVATYVDGDQQYVVRLGLDGTVERVTGPVTSDPGTLALRLTPGVLG